MIAARDTRRVGKRKADVRDWAKPKHRPLTRVNVPNPGEPSRQLAVLAVIAWLAFLIGCCLLAWFWTSDLVQSFLAVVRGAA